MALSKKQVKQLRAMANQLNPLLYIGKNDLTDAAVKQASETMDSHELLKVAVQDGSGLTAKEAADKLAGQIGAQVVQVIGNRFVLYRKRPRNATDHSRLPRAGRGPNSSCANLVVAPTRLSCGGHNHIFSACRSLLQ